jgi:RNA 3'-terminal phosphate cyclase (ATP)
VIEATRDSAGPGNVTMVELGSAGVTAIFTAFGQLGVSAEKVADSAAREGREYLV